MVQPIIPIKNGIMVNGNVIVKNFVHAKKVIVGILAHVFLRIVGIYKRYC